MHPEAFSSSLAACHLGKETDSIWLQPLLRFCLMQGYCSYCSLAVPCFLKLNFHKENTTLWPVNSTCAPWDLSQLCVTQADGLWTVSKAAFPKLRHPTFVLESKLQGNESTGSWHDHKQQLALKVPLLTFAQIQEQRGFVWLLVVHPCWCS